jgi:hypothetical protein
MSKYTTYCVDGYWNDGGEKFEGMCVAIEEWDGIEDAEDEEIFYYLDGEPILGDHGDFTIVEVQE